jgi:hypothetical protein
MVNAMQVTFIIIIHIWSSSSSELATRAWWWWWSAAASPGAAAKAVDLSRMNLPSLYLWLLSKATRYFQPSMAPQATQKMSHTVCRPVVIIRSSSFVPTFTFTLHMYTYIISMFISTNNIILILKREKAVQDCKSSYILLKR